MKIAYIVFAGKGLESFVYREIDELTKKGLDITIYTTRYKKGDIYSPKRNWLVEKINLLKIFPSLLFWIFFKPVTTFNLLINSFRYKTSIELFIAFDYALRMKYSQISHIHCHFGDRKFFIGYYCKMLLKIPLSVTVHAHELYVNPNPKFFKYSINSADKIVSISEKNKNILIENFAVDKNKIQVIRLSVDLSNFKKTEKIKVLTVARYTERKGFNELFMSIKTICKSNPNIEFITVGFGDLDLHKMAKKYDICDYVTIFDKMNQNQLSFMYNVCDIFCLPSKSTKDEGAEGIPVVLMEAMSSEMLIVTTRNGSIEELVNEILVNENDVNSLVEGLNRAFELLTSKNKFGIENRRKVMDEFSEKNIDILKSYLYE